MNIAQTMKERSSVRGFIDKPVPDDVLQRIFKDAQKSPSNCNTQPWKVYVFSGEKKNELSRKLVEELQSGRPPVPDFEWSVKYQGGHRERQFASAAALYGALGVEREDKQARASAMLKNWQFFGAPHVAFFTMEKYLGIMGAVDLGIYAQSLSLLLAENGISSCMQGALGQFPAPVRAMTGMLDSEGVLFGMSFGYADSDAPANAAKTDRAELSDAVHFIV
ncbi:nitroreductase [Spongiibacter sp. KMU-166]|uniref:Nitroreductase n=2 Tax=Spongiibacter thalassae TaxID=2721624 RepID=A0ABX1G9R1_9GAMM|nr:nitroreductase [Spongiibacter thalassae]